jgi:hypothetical protein
MRRGGKRARAELDAVAVEDIWKKGEERTEGESASGRKREVSGGIN